MDSSQDEEVAPTTKPTPVLSNDATGEDAVGGKTSPTRQNAPHRIQ